MGCCQWENSQCWSAVGTGACYSSTCVTLSSESSGGQPAGEECIFPFTVSSGATFYNCEETRGFIESDPDPWCSTQVDSDGNHVNGQSQWGFCEPSDACFPPDDDRNAGTARSPARDGIRPHPDPTHTLFLARSLARCLARSLTPPYPYCPTDRQTASAQRSTRAISARARRCADARTAITMIRGTGVKSQTPTA